MARVEHTLDSLSIEQSPAGWVAATYITDDTEALSAEAQKNLRRGRAAPRGRRRASTPAAAAGRSAASSRCSSSRSPRPAAGRPRRGRRADAPHHEHGGRLRQGRVCRRRRRDRQAEGEECRQIASVAGCWPRAATRRAARARGRAGTESRRRCATATRASSSSPTRARARSGSRDIGALWRSGYDMPARRVRAETERLWKQVQPLYDDAALLRARASWSSSTARRLVPPDGLIPAHLLGNMWAQEWGEHLPAASSRTAPPGGATTCTKLLEAKKARRDEHGELGEGFFTSLGLDPLPKTFWERSLFVKPRDREVVCHASAWDVDNDDDLRIKMCIEPTEEDFVTIHHELGHNYYHSPTTTCRCSSRPARTTASTRPSATRSRSPSRPST